MPESKIRTLINADFTGLSGHFPITCSYVLRLLLLFSNATDAKNAQQRVLAVLTLPFLSHLKESLKKQLKCYFLFAVDLLVRQNLINLRGIPQGLAGLVTHIHYKEPGNMVFVHLLKAGIFHEICKPSKNIEEIHYNYKCQKCLKSPIVGSRVECKQCELYNYSLCKKCFECDANHYRHSRSSFINASAQLKYYFSEQTLRIIVLILCHLFSTRHIPRSNLKKIAGKTVLKIKPECGSRVILEKLPSKIEGMIEKYNHQVSSIFGDYLICLSHAGDHDQADAYSQENKGASFLPMSEKIPLKGIQSINSSISPFAMLSGANNDTIYEYCDDANELKKLLSKDAFMDANLIPTIDRRRVLNAYALDFFKNPSIEALMVDNRLQQGDVYNELLEFMLTIMSISTGLEQLTKECDENDYVVGAFKHLKFVYQSRFYSVFPYYKLPV